MYLYGIIIAYICTKIIFGKIKSRKKPNIIINIPPFIINSKVIIFNKHIHHWLIFFIILLLLLIFRKNMSKYKSIYKFSIGFSLYMIVHGLQYKDAFDFKNRPYLFNTI